ncbi:MAG: hypothetical protein HQK49_04540 [Oligoflexia bacterium]|nr:hypothetical protein [Oligoflexia bacterium]
MENENNLKNQSEVKTSSFNFFSRASKVDKSKIKEQLDKISELRLSDFLNSTETEFKDHVNEMLSTIKELDSNFRDTLKLNHTLRGELHDCKQVISKLNNENKGFEKKLAEFENSSPIIGETEKKLNLVVEERDKYKERYNQAIENNQKLIQNLNVLNNLVDLKKEEIEDLKRELEILKSKLDSYVMDFDSNEVKSAKEKEASFIKELKNE